MQTALPGAFAIVGPGSLSTVATSQNDSSSSLQHHGKNIPDMSGPIIAAELVENDNWSAIRKEMLNEMQHANLALVAMDPLNEGSLAQS